MMARPMPLLPPVTIATFPLTLTSCPPLAPGSRAFVICAQSYYTQVRRACPAGGKPFPSLGRTARRSRDLADQAMTRRPLTVTFLRKPRGERSGRERHRVEGMEAFRPQGGRTDDGDDTGTAG